MQAKNIGVLRDIKNGEFRVAMTPGEVRELVPDGISVFVASGAGEKPDSKTKPTLMREL